jgi:hypothetical protein
MRVYRYEYKDFKKKQDLKLQESEIHLWVIPWKEAESFTLSKETLLTAKEKEKINNFKFCEDRMRGMTGKVFTRMLLARYAQQPDETILINNFFLDFGRRKKPLLKPLAPDCRKDCIPLKSVTEIYMSRERNYQAGILYPLK